MHSMLPWCVSIYLVHYTLAATEVRTPVCSKPQNNSLKTPEVNLLSCLRVSGISMKYRKAGANSVTRMSTRFLHFMEKSL